QSLPHDNQQQDQSIFQQRSNEGPSKQVLDQSLGAQQQFNVPPVETHQSNFLHSQQLNAPSGQQMVGQPNAVPMQEFNVPPQQSAQLQPPVMSQQQQQVNVPPVQPVPSANQAQAHVVPQQQQQINVPPAQPVPTMNQPEVPLHDLNARKMPQQVPVPQQQQRQSGTVPQQQQQVNVQPTQPVSSINQPEVQQIPQQVPVVQQQQQRSPSQSPPVSNKQVPPVKSPPEPSHVHNELPHRGYERHAHESSPPKPKQMEFHPPIFLHQDSELDFYSRLPSPQKSDSDILKNVDLMRPFLSLTVNVTPAVKDCYFYEAVTGFEVDVQVLGGDGMDIGLCVFDPSGAPVVLRDPVGEASVSITVLPQYQGRAYAICLDNRKASYGRKKVYLGIDLRINWDKPSPAEQEIIDQMKRNLRIGGNSAELRRVFDNFDRLTDSLDRIGGLLHRTQRLQQRSRNNAAMDRAMMEANKDRVTSWSTFQVVLLVLVGIIQTRLIRSLFDEQSSLYRLWVHDGSGRSGSSTRYCNMAATETATSGPPARDLNDPAEKAAWQTANQAAEKISSLYYRSFDKQGRLDLPTFFVESVTLIWNGNQVVGRQAVADFLSTKLPKSQTTVHTISAQPVQKLLSGDNTVVMVNIVGSMKFEGNPPKMFAETFFLIKDGNLWRIQSTTFRFIE
ncbi:unnamed protein product, partial [Hydatigera taeniaeformis]|uniref:NTF2 domain-containing protein n=1 Tax=Hydatigena taeniaeformis TaxID=6205 RepID=A0A0R3WRH9_HYDTA